jgi:SH3-like domain-containing protein
LSWKFVRSGIPLIVLAEVGIWRKIQDAEGEEGWIHQNMLTMRRSALVIEKTHSLLDKPSADAQVVAYLEPGTSAQLQEIRGDWLRVKVERLTGWLHRSQTWGVLKGEKDRRF